MSEGEVKRYYGSKVAGDHALTIEEAKGDCESELVKGRTLTSWPTLQTDIRNAGGNWVDEEVHVDEGLTTSRKPDDLDAFCAKAVEELAEGVHEGQRASVGAS